MTMIIFLNGASSSGKSSIARELQKVYDEPLLTIGIDTFLDMMPEEYLFFGAKASEGFRFKTDCDDLGPCTNITAGPLGENVFSIIPEIIATMAGRGFNIIVDEVLFEADALKRYVKLLHKHPVYFIGIHCELPELVRREKVRGDRVLGLSRAQANKVHAPIRFYDLELNTTVVTPVDAAMKIIELLKSNNSPNSFQKLYQHFYGERVI